jgi:excisionase family DNA binding protein
MATNLQVQVDQTRVDLTAGGFLTVPEAAAFLRLSRAKVYQMMDCGQLRYAKFGKSRRVPRQALQDLAQAALVG